MAQEGGLRPSLALVNVHLDREIRQLIKQATDRMMNLFDGVFKHLVKPLGMSSGRWTGF
jgi:hypothetical protein